MKIIKKHFVIVGIILFIFLSLFFCIITSRNIEESKTVENCGSWNYTVKTSIIFKKVTSTVNASHKKSFTTISLGDKVESSGISPTGGTAKAELKGNLLKTAYVYWALIE